MFDDDLPTDDLPTDDLPTNNDEAVLPRKDLMGLSNSMLQEFQQSYKWMNAIKSSFLSTDIMSSLMCPPIDMGNIIAAMRPSIDLSSSLTSLSSSLIDIKQTFDWLGSITSAIGSIKAWMPPNFRRLEETVRLRVLSAFEKAGLCLAPSMSEDLMYQIEWYASKGDLRPVTLLIWHYYADNDCARLRRAVLGWQSNYEFAARRRFFDAALKTHIQGIYEASVSTLMSQIEGISSSFVYSNAIKSGIKNKGFRLGNTEKVVLYMLNVVGGIPNLDADVVGFMGWIMVKSIVRYVQGLFQWVDFEKDFEKVRKSRVLHRHGSLHGIQLEYPTPMNSLRLFLLYDAIHYMLESYENYGMVWWYGNKDEGELNTLECLLELASSRCVWAC